MKITPYNDFEELAKKEKYKLAMKIDFIDIDAIEGDTDQFGLVDMCRLVKGSDLSVFQFGTFRGDSVFKLAINSTKPVYTIDIGDSTEYGVYMVGELFKGTHVEKNIVSIISDSTKYDYSDLYGKFDLVFIDGGHEPDVVLHDTKQAFKLLKKKGIVVWDDVRHQKYGKEIKKILKSFGIPYQFNKCGFIIAVVERE